MFELEGFTKKSNPELNGLINTTAISWALSRTLSTEKTNLILTSTDHQAKNLAKNLNFFLKNKSIRYYPALDKLIYENLEPHSDIAANRLNLTLGGIGHQDIIVSSITAACENTLSAKILHKQILTIKIGEELIPEDIVKNLQVIGYQKTKFTEKIGCYSWHGQTLDVFPINKIENNSQPIRIEFSHSRVLSIKYFNSKTQRSGESLDSQVKIFPAREIISDFKITDIQSLINNLTISDKKSQELEFAIKSQGLNNSFGEDISLLLTKQLDNLIKNISQTPSEIYLINPEETTEIYQKQLKLAEERYLRLSSENFCLPPENYYLSNSEIKKLCKEAIPINYQQNNQPNSKFIKENNHELNQISSYQYSVKKNPLLEYLNVFLKQNYRFIIVANSAIRIKRIKKLVSELRSDNIKIVAGEITDGFKVTNQNLIYIAEKEIFPTISSREDRPILNFSLKHILSSLSTLDINDIVVHEDYGLGKYLGLKKIELSEEIKGEFIALQYIDSTLYLPVQKIGRIQKYSGLTEREVKLDRLGSKRWEKVKKKIKKSINDLAGELLKLYALRSSQVAERCLEYNELDQEFADSFPYNETEEQLEAINQTLQDLCSGQIMDRLICGDVGFGKTEIALRASFKVAMEGKQVAILAPTTLLVEQHFENFKERFAPYPIKIGVLSRFYSDRQNKKTLEELKEGKINIIIGTHALIKNRNIFANLGLFVIDEEQRFGVKQKEKIKQMQVNTHVLTLSATPIPRTLYMSLINIKDISVISSPPSNRLAVKTFLHETDPEIIRDAILKEINRDGQVYYLHNRVQDIELVVAELREIVPEAKIAYAHGQMPESQLEKIMSNFKENNFNLLVTTTIIENGIDLPNANTMIIDRADCFGLAQLYQLRGRVGRSSRQAYTHLLIPSLKKISIDAKERLNALRSINQLGGGFQLAIRDLEIRGAGNVLGREQSGNIAEIGYDLYTQLLNQAIENLRGNFSTNSLEPEIKLPVNAYIPEDYLIDPSERVILYQRFASLNSNEEIDSLINEVRDRYGNTPQELDNYARLMQLKLILKNYQVYELDYRNSNLYLKINKHNNINSNKIIKLIKEQPEHYQLSRESLIIRNPQLNPEDLDEIKSFVVKMLQTLSDS